MEAIRAPLPSDSVLGPAHDVPDDRVIWRYAAIERFLDLLFGHIEMTRARRHVG